MMKTGMTCFLVSFAFLSTVSGDPRIWDGSSGYWTDGSKWGGTVPQAGDAVTMPIGTYTVTLDGATADLSAYTQNGGTLFFTNWNACLRATDVLVQSGRMDHAVCDTNLAPGVTNRVFVLGTNVTIGALAVLDVTGRGFLGSLTVGKGPGGGASECGGGRSGGLGGRGHHLTGGITPGYGSPDEPVFPGSGGGGGDGSNRGGNGGGMIWVEASGTLTVEGIVSAQGAASTASRGGGGSGGSILLSCRTFQGQGLMNAAGGNGTFNGYGGGGGGGRLAIRFDAPAQSNATPAIGYTVRLEGGRGVQGTGQPGTLYVSDRTVFPEPWPRDAIFHFGVPVSFSIASLALTNYSLGFGDAGARLEVEDDLTIFSANGRYGFTMASGAVLQVGGGLMVSNAFLLMPSAMLNCQGDTALKNAKVDVSTGHLQGSLTIGTTGVASGVTLTNTPDFRVSGEVLLNSNTFIRLHSGTNTAGRLVCDRSLTLDGSQIYLISCPTGAPSGEYGAAIYVAGDLALTNGGFIQTALVEQRNGAKNAGYALLGVRNLRIASGCGIYGDGLGYAGRTAVSPDNTNDGFGPGGGFYYAGGAGYGATGGVGHASIGPRYGGFVYGNSNAPVQPGSGGGPAAANGSGGAGGGAVVIEAARAVFVDGVISMNGTNGVTRGGGGSGGSIWIRCRTISGNGLLSARGGNSALPTTYGGGGGGGRIAVYYSEDGFAGAWNIAGGSGGYQNALSGSLVWEWAPLKGGTIIMMH